MTGAASAAATHRTRVAAWTILIEAAELLVRSGRRIVPLALVATLPERFFLVVALWNFGLPPANFEVGFWPNGWSVFGIVAAIVIRVALAPVVELRILRAIADERSSPRLRIRDVTNAIRTDALTRILPAALVLTPTVVFARDALLALQAKDATRWVLDVERAVLSGVVLGIVAATLHVLVATAMPHVSFGSRCLDATRASARLVRGAVATRVVVIGVASTLSLAGLFLAFYLGNLIDGFLHWAIPVATRVDATSVLLWVSAAIVSLVSAFTSAVTRAFSSAVSLRLAVHDSGTVGQVRPHQ